MTDFSHRKQYGWPRDNPIYNLARMIRQLLLIVYIIEKKNRSHDDNEQNDGTKRIFKIANSFSFDLFSASTPGHINSYIAS